MENSSQSVALEEIAAKFPPGKPSYFANTTVWPTVKPFVNGGLAGILTLSPAYFWASGARYLHFCKAKSVCSSEELAQLKAKLYSSGQVHYIFKRFPALLLSYATNTTARFGFYAILTKRVEAANGGSSLTLYQEACCGLTAGAIGAFLAFPLHLTYKLMVEDARLPSAQQLKYRNVFHAFSHTVADRGVLAIWKGAGPIVNSEMALGMGMLASYNRSFNYFKESIGLSEYSTRLSAGAVSGFFASACSLPVLNAYAFMQVSNGRISCTSPLHCAWKVMRWGGGPSVLYIGFAHHLAWTAPRVMLIWLLYREILDIEGSMGL